MLQVEDVNCFCIDWSGGSRALYSQAANNIRVVGAEVAYFIDVLSVGGWQLCWLVDNSRKDYVMKFVVRVSMSVIYNSSSMGNPWFFWSSGWGISQSRQRILLLPWEGSFGHIFLF